jgi:hypothetical protein
MRHALGSILEVLGMSLMPGMTLGLFVLVSSAALGAISALVESITTVPFWAQAYLAVATLGPLALLVPILVPVRLRMPRRRSGPVIPGHRPGGFR